MGVVLSILTPVKNAEKWLGECIASGSHQSYKDWEWIFVDDHSTDHSVELVKSLSDKDPRIRLFQNPGKGIITALQKALAESQGKYVTRMDADDVMPAKRLHKMVDAIEECSTGTVVTGLVKYFTKGLESPGYQKYEQWLNTTLLEGQCWPKVYRECVIASPNWIIRRNDLIGCGGFESLSYPEDYDLVFRWYQNNFEVFTIPEVTLLWREHADRTSRNSEHYQQESFYRLKINRFIELD